jgi:hypothetical protein
MDQQEPSNRAEQPTSTRTGMRAQPWKEHWTPKDQVDPGYKFRSKKERDDDDDDTMVTMGN